MFQLIEKEDILRLIHVTKRQFSLPYIQQFCTFFEDIVFKYGESNPTYIPPISLHQYNYPLNFKKEIGKILTIHFRVDLLIEHLNMHSHLSKKMEVELDLIDIDKTLNYDPNYSFKETISPILIQYPHFNLDRNIFYIHKAIDGNHRLYHQEQLSTKKVLCHILEENVLELIYFCDINSFLAYHFISFVVEQYYFCQNNEELAKRHLSCKISFINGNISSYFKSHTDTLQVKVQHHGFE